MIGNKKQKSKKTEEVLGGGSKKWGYWHFLAVFWALFLLAQYFFSMNESKVSYSEFLNYLEDNQITEVVVSEGSIRAQLKTQVDKKNKFINTVPLKDDKLADKLILKGVNIKVLPQSTFWGAVISWLLPLGLMLLFFNFMIKRAAGSARGGLLPFGKSKARVYVEKGIATTFADIAGVEEAKEELKEIVGFLKDPSEFGKLGGRAPRGILLVGPPGTGKTLMARAMAGEAGVPFYYINGSEFVEMFVGMGAARVRDLFEQARNHSPCIIFIDELDALGKARMNGFSGSGGNDEKEQTLNQLLAELDGFDSKEGVILLAATNRPEVLDPALLRSGRFDRQVLIDKPDIKGRVAILKIHCKKITLNPGFDLENIAALTPGFSGADLENLVNEAALVATRRRGESVNKDDFILAIERIVAGLERKNRIINPEEKCRVAYHEMGHVTVALALECQDRVQKVSIIPRGIGALGYTLQRPTEDRYLLTQSQLEDKIAVLLGGRVSEQTFFHDVSTGASDDLNKATDIARAMVTQYSMSEELGLPTFERRDNQFLQTDFPFAQKSSMSEQTSQIIDKEVCRILEKCREKAASLVTANKEFIKTAVEKLIEKETLEERELAYLWQEKSSKKILKNSAGQDDPPPIVDPLI